MSNIVKEMCEIVKLPKMTKVKQNFLKKKIAKDEIRSSVFRQFEREDIKSLIKPNGRIAITCGSRGVANIALITKSIVDFVKQYDARPFVFPAMGSHGGATAEGQKEILLSYGITEEYLECPIISSMQTVRIGETAEGHQVLIDKNAAAADGIIVVGRVKPHTAYRGEYESGIMKMITIGLGKKEGAEICHADGFKHMAHLVPLIGNVILKKANIIGALAILENAYDETYKLVSMNKDEIPALEPLLLKEARSLMAQILFEETDVLVIDQIGKNISGDGMDPNITGTFCTPYASGGINAQRVVVLDLTDETHGSAIGVGMADCTTRRLLNKINLEMTYPNAITCTVLDLAKIPCILENDKNAIQLAVRTCNEIDKKNPRIIRIRNSLQLEEIYISQALIPIAKKNEYIEIIGELESFDFNSKGNLFS